MSKSGVSCHWGSNCAGAFSYADDVVLLAPCASVLRTMLNICSSFAVFHKLEFKSMKTQLMCFHCPSVYPITADIYLNNIKLSFVSHVKHLGHILSSNLDDTLDIQRAVKDLNCKANNLLCTFHSLDPLIKTFLFRSYCLSLYGCCLRSLNSSSINAIEIALNKILRTIWHLHLRSHIGIVHCVSQIPTVSNMLYNRFTGFLSKALLSSSSFVRSIFNESMYFTYSSTSYNFRYGYLHIKGFCIADFNFGSIIRQIRCYHGLQSPYESLIEFVSCH